MRLQASVPECALTSAKLERSEHHGFAMPPGLSTQQSNVPKQIAQDSVEYQVAGRISKGCKTSLRIAEKAEQTFGVHAMANQMHSIQLYLEVSMTRKVTTMRTESPAGCTGGAGSQGSPWER